MLLQPRQLRAERPDVSALERIVSRLFALRLVLRDLFLPLLSAMRVARSQSLVALRGRREKGRVSLRRGACRVEETLRIADFVGRGKDVGASGKRTFPMANPRAGWKPYAYVTGSKPAAEDRRDTHRLARARGVSATFRTRVPSCETRLGLRCLRVICAHDGKKNPAVDPKLALPPRTTPLDWPSGRECSRSRRGDSLEVDSHRTFEMADTTLSVENVVTAGETTGRELSWSHATTIAANGNGAERAEEANKLRLKVQSEEFGKRKDCTDMMERMMLSAVSRLPPDPLVYMLEYLEREVDTGKIEPLGDSVKGWGEGLHGRDRDLEEETTEFASRMDFQTICYKLSAAMIEVKPEDPVVFALNFLRKLKKERDGA